MFTCSRNCVRLWKHCSLLLQSLVKYTERPLQECCQLAVHSCKQLFWCHYLVVIGALKAGSFHHIYHQLHHMPLFMGGSHSTCRSTTQQLHQNLPMVAQVDLVYLLWCCSIDIRSITKPNSKRITTAFSSSYSIKKLKQMDSHRVMMET